MNYSKALSPAADFFYSVSVEQAKHLAAISRISLTVCESGLHVFGPTLPHSI